MSEPVFYDDIVSMVRVCKGTMARSEQVIIAANAEVDRLTAELAEEKASRVMAEEAYDEASKWYAAAVAREKALLAITGQMLDGKDFRGWDEDEAAGYQTACDEWDRRARGRT